MKSYFDMSLCDMYGTLLKSNVLFNSSKNILNIILSAEYQITFPIFF